MNVDAPFPPCVLPIVHKGLPGACALPLLDTTDIRLRNGTSLALSLEA
jgi:hypothetical protein